MSKIKIATGVVHTIPKDLREIFEENVTVLGRWNELTPLARNEWICYVTIVNKEETRQEHLVRLQVDLLSGKKAAMLLAWLPTPKA